MADFAPIFSPPLAQNQRVTSTELNQLDADHVNSLNKTGGTITGYITITGTGEMEWLANSTLQMDTASTATLDGYITIGSTATFLSLTNMVLAGSAGLALSSGSYILFQSGSYIQGNVSWVSTEANPVLTQATTSGAGTSLTIQAQSSSSNTGGTLSLKPGNGISGGAINLYDSGGSIAAQTGDGAFIFYPLGGGGSSATLLPFQGSVNTQKQVVIQAPFVCSTSASGSNAIFYNLNMANNTAALLEVTWVRRTPTSVNTSLANRMGIAAYCDHTGATSYSNQIAYASGMDASNVIAISVSTNGGSNNLCQLQAVAQSTAQDWLIYVNVLYS